MITPTLAKQLKEAGLVWDPQLHDFFMVPEPNLEDRVFVLADLQAYLELYQGRPVVTFHGTAEWALDYILQSEVIWMPTDAQLREILVGLVPGLVLRHTPPAGYTCTIRLAGQTVSFAADQASDAYGQALLHLMQTQQVDERVN